MLTDSPAETPLRAAPQHRPALPVLATAATFAVAGFAIGWFAHQPSIPAARATAIPAHAATASAPVAASPSVSAQPATTSTAADATAAALAAARQPPGRAAKLYEFAQRLRELDPAQYPALLQGLRRSHLPDTSEMLAMLCSVWAAHDGATAFAAARSLAGTDSEYGALHAAITAWASHDPAAARTALQTAQLTALTSDEMSAFVQGWASVDRAAAEDFLQHAAHTTGDAADLPPTVLRGYEAIAAARIQDHPANALAWYKGLDQPLRVRTQQAFLSQLAAADPQLADQWLASDATPRFGESDLLPVLRGLQLNGWDQQFAWARQAANADTRDAALSAVVHDGAGTDLVSLGEWLAARSEDATLNGAFSAYAARVVRKSPEAAITWASNLDSADLRHRTLTAVVSEWASYDFRAAHAWAQRTHLVDWEAIAR